MTIILIGYRASGKTTLGKRLAEHLGLPFVDTDDLILQHFGTDSVAEIWDTHGEAEFRRIEIEVVRQTVAGKDQVIGLGGGTLMQPGARQAVEQADALRVYLACDPQELASRIGEDDKTSRTRPNLTNLGGGIEEILAVLEEREPVYQQVADQTIDVTGLTAEKAFKRFIETCIPTLEG